MKILYTVMIAIGLIWATLSYIPHQTITDIPEQADLPPTVQFALSAALGREVEDYHATQTHTGYRLTNLAQGMRADLTSQGVRIVAGEVNWSLALIEWGYGDKLQSVTNAMPQANANRIKYQRGSLTEWYINGPRGLQQGFTLAAAPEVGSSDEPLTIALISSLPLHLDTDRRGLTAARLHYSGLIAYDATGQLLPAWLETRDERLLLRVDDRDAHYPLVIDPFVQIAKLLASDGATNARFGYSVAVSGDTIVVGADLAYINSNYVQGTAYVFVKPSNGWSGSLTQTAKLIASDGMMGDQFGWSVAISGDTIVVGALGDDSAYIFVKPPTGWKGVITETARLIPPDNARLFGDSVAVNDNTAVVVARGNNINPNQGAAYIYLKPAGGWVTTSTFTAKLIPSAGTWGSGYQAPMAISSDTVVVGAAFPLNGSSTGSVNLFVKPPGGWSGTLTETTKLTASDGATGDLFGQSVAIDNNTVAVGAIGDQIGNNDGQGSAYVFTKPSGGWPSTLMETAKLIASDGAAWDGLGWSTTISGNTIVVGVPSDDINNNSGQGSAYLFVKPTGGWNGMLTETTKLTAIDGTANDYFGHSVAIENSSIIVGTIGKDSFTGSAYVFTTTSTTANLGLSKSDGQTNAAPGDSITYTLIVTNYGPSAVTEALVSDTMPVVLTGTTWSCVPFDGASCGTSGGTGSLNHTVNLPVNSKAIFTISGMIVSTASGILTNTASIVMLVDFIDTNPNNNSATDTTTLTSSSSLPVYLPAILQ